MGEFKQKNIEMLECKKGHFRYLTGRICAVTQRLTTESNFVYLYIDPGINLISNCALQTGETVCHKGIFNLGK